MGVKISYYGKLGELFVAKVWDKTDVVQFTLNKYERCFIGEEQIIWLKAHVPNIKVIQVKTMIEEIEL